MAIGCSTCCGSCGDSNGKQHDLQCQSEKDGRDAAGLEATADQLVKVAQDKSADIMKNAPVAADIDKYTTCVCSEPTKCSPLNPNTDKTVLVGVVLLTGSPVYAELS